MDKTINDYKNEYITIFKSKIKRDGADKLLEYIETTDFFTAPASGKRHNNFEGGLVQHSLNVYNRLIKNIRAEYGDNYTDKISDETIAIMALLHDLCKVNTYKLDYRNQKVDGQWVQVPYFAYNNTLPYGHGEKSVYIISGFMRLTREEAMAINWHMGPTDPRALFSSDVNDAFYRYPVAVLLYLADLQATFLDEQVK